MTRPAWLRDSITLRFAFAIGAAATVAIGLNLLVDRLLGGPAFPSPNQVGLLDQLPTIVRRLNTAPDDHRDALAKIMSTPKFRIEWCGKKPSAVPAGGMPGVAAICGRAVAAETLLKPLDDGSWMTVTRLQSGDGFPQTNWRALRLGTILLSLALVSLIGAARLARPIDAFAAAALRFGANPNAAPMTPQGPAELQSAIAAFNAMQSQIQRFVSGQAAMFAAISHDLRTPLTRMRLRGEFIEDLEQQARLFRDVDEMQTMLNAALEFLRDNAAAEATTRLDLAELLRSVTDDYADLGHDVPYTGPEHLAYPGRPVGLRRAFGNLVDNAVKYGMRAKLHLRLAGDHVHVMIVDDGPGIPPHALEEVFTPFQRLEPSRSRDTGGIGLGLTSARACFRAHGGDVTLSNLPGGGVCATVALPCPPAD